MNLEVRNKWTKALRSGDYPQGRNTLHDQDHDEWCCLGVLCSLAVAEGVATATTRRYNGRSFTNFDGQEATLPISVRDWAGMKSTNGDLGHGLSLVDMNDARRKSFDQIADLIESRSDWL